MTRHPLWFTTLVGRGGGLERGRGRRGSGRFVVGAGPRRGVFVVALGLLAASTSAVRAQEPIGARPGVAVDSAMAEWGEGTPGGVVAVTRGGELIFARGYGEANLEYGVPNSPATPYHMASVSKQFTAFAILMLAEEGRLSLDDDVRAHIPELADFGERITLRHLLTHTSGLRDQWSLWVMSGGRMDDVIRQEDLLALVLHQRELNFPPGSEYLYSNSGYMLLAEVVERVTGEEFREWMRSNVFEPLGMESTQIYDDHERIVPGRAYSYRPAGGSDAAGDDDDEGGGPAFEKAVLSYANAGATSLFTTAEDLVRWLRNYRTAEVGGPAVLARLEERGVLTSGDTIDYALGVSMGDHRGLRRIAHGGADAGYRTMLAYYPELDAGVIVLGNSASFSSGRVAQQAAEAFFGPEMGPDPADRGELEGGATAADPDAIAEADAVAEAEPVVVAPERLERYVGEYQLEDGPTLEVTLEDGAFRVRLANQPTFELTALADTLFRVEVSGVDARLAFHAGPEGRVDRGTVHQDGQASPFRRIDRWSPPAEALEAYAGRYYSPELETAYVVVVEGDGLVARHRRHGPIELMPREEDRFDGGVWFFRDVVFERDETGLVTGMRVSNGRVRELRFDRSSP